MRARETGGRLERKADRFDRVAGILAAGFDRSVLGILAGKMEVWSQPTGDTEASRPFDMRFQKAHGERRGVPSASPGWMKAQLERLD